MGNSNKKSPTTKLTKQDIEYLKKHTNFQEEAIKEWYYGFRKDCPSGQLNRTKFISMYSQVFPSGNADVFSQHVFRTFDTDGSGTIDFREFLLALHVTSNGTPK
ncbi:neuronal calcium sensor 2 [Eurytemora carolleeae]|uniref:neuronal calcium sensor 2 n=1 Tax=Eurytemora carolleeae TaxID=1294199 RepID=UPI000C793222|nr:neuronal calcium sensor 2 [Eurytemora carolleeae]|eukprot:XP_023346210.1 neuronal calcium sensor 2-like [Eurytemora affinis]